MFKKKIFDNGVRLVYESIPYLRSVSIGVWVGTGSRCENELNNGISHFIEHMLFKGTEKRTSKDIAQSIEGIGGQLNAFTGKECTCYYAKTLDENIGIAVDVLADIFFNSRLNPGDVDTEKKVIFEEISMYEDTPDDLVHDILSRNMWKGDSLGLPILGTARCLEKMDYNVLREFINKNYLPDNTVISVAGNFNEHMLLELIEKYFGNWQSDIKSEKTDWLSKYIKGVNIKQKDIEQVHLCMGFEGVRHGSEELYDLLTVNNIFGGTMSSKLFQRIREEYGLVYSVYSYPSSYRGAGMYTIYAGMNPLHLKKVISLIIKEVKDILNNGIKREELQRAKDQLKGNYILGLESTGSRMNGIGKAEILMGYIHTPDEILAKIDAVKIDRAYEVISRVLDLENMSVAIVGNVDKKFKLDDLIEPVK